MDIRKRISAGLLSAFFLGLPGLAQTELKASEGIKEAGQASAEHADLIARRAAVSTAATPSAGNSEVFRGILVPKGKSVYLESVQDYSSSASVAVTVFCSICNSAGAALGASGLVLQAMWLVPGADTYVVPEWKAASAFAYWDVGGALFNVYGPQFRLNLQNKGNQDVALQQVTLFRRAQ